MDAPLCRPLEKSFYLLLTSSNISWERSHFIFLVLALTNNTVLLLEWLLVSVLFEDLAQTLPSQKLLGLPVREFMYVEITSLELYFSGHLGESLIFLSFLLILGEAEPLKQCLQVYSFPRMYQESGNSNAIQVQGCHGFPVWDCHTNVRM